MIPIHILFEYLFNKYGLSNGIFVYTNNPVFPYINTWTIEESNSLYKFRSIQEFNEAYNILINLNIEYILYRTDRATLKYYPTAKRLVLHTEEYNDIHIIQLNIQS